MSFTKRKRFSFLSPDTRRLIGIALAFALMLSLIAANRFITFIFYSILKELGLVVDAQDIVNIAPTHTCTSNIAGDIAAESLAIARRKTHEKPLFLSMDAANKDGLHHMAKEIAC